MSMARKKYFLQYNSNLVKEEKRKLECESPYYGMYRYKYYGSEDPPRVYYAL